MLLFSLYTLSRFSSFFFVYCFELKVCQRAFRQQHIMYVILLTVWMMNVWTLILVGRYLRLRLSAWIRTGSKISANKHTLYSIYMLSHTYTHRHKVFHPDTDLSISTSDKLSRNKLLRIFFYRVQFTFYTLHPTLTRFYFVMTNIRTATLMLSWMLSQTCRLLYTFKNTSFLPVHHCILGQCKTISSKWMWKHLTYVGEKISIKVLTYKSQR